VFAQGFRLEWPSFRQDKNVNAIGNAILLLPPPIAFWGTNIPHHHLVR
jgi:hypothetical protein